MNHCTIAYSIYETDLRVKRYAEAVKGHGSRLDAIALSGRGANTDRLELNGIILHHILDRSFKEMKRYEFVSKIIRFFLRGSIVLLKNHLRYRYKIIHIHNVPDFLVFMAIIPKLMGAKIILDIHDIMPELYCERFNRPVSSFFAKMLLVLEWMSVRFADYVITANDLWRDKIIRRTRIDPKKCMTILNYPNIHFYENMKEQRLHGLNLVYAGHISYHHGIDIAIKGFVLVKNEVPEARFDIYVRTFVSDYLREIEELVKKLDLEGIIKFHGAMPPEEISKAYEAATIGIVPKRGGLFASEALSSKIFDFFAAGLPVVASKTRISEYYFGRKDLIKFFRKDDAEDFARAVIELHNAPDRQLRMIKNGLEYVKTNNWEAKKSSYLSILHSL